MRGTNCHHPIYFGVPSRSVRSAPSLVPIGTSCAQLGLARSWQAGVRGCRAPATGCFALRSAQARTANAKAPGPFFLIWQCCAKDLKAGRAREAASTGFMYYLGGT